jgi:uncharacterized membrane protein YqgA involved in biofilm formation
MFFPTGVVVDCASVALGGLAGVALARRIRPQWCQTLTLIFGVCSMAMGVVSVAKAAQLPAVILSVLLGVLLGETLRLEQRVQSLADRLRRPLSGCFAGEDEAALAKLISILVLFCASGTGIFGALESGITGQHDILLAKAILDFFTAAIFAVSLGAVVSLIALPQAVILLALFLVAGRLMPLTTPTMLQDFSACGGVLMLATGLRIAEIKRIPIVNMLPAMALALPLSALWTRLFAGG